MRLPPHLGATSLGQNTSGVLQLNFPGGAAHALPVGNIIVDTSRPDGATLTGNGTVEIAINGVITTFAPSLVDVGQFATQLTRLDGTANAVVQEDGR